MKSKRTPPDEAFYNFIDHNDDEFAILFWFTCGVCMVLTFAFWMMKLAQIGLVAEWSWWRVFSPLAVPPAYILLIMTGASVAGLLTLLIKK
jgi:hypothetical protein